MRRLHSTAKYAATSATLIALGTLAACDGSSVIGGGTGGGSSSSTGATSSTSTGGGALPKVDKVDIVVSVDNSRSMADKQEVLALALADLVQSLTNPLCVDGQGHPAVMQPATNVDPCPSGSTREFAPIFDIHVGIISSSLGGHGSDACSVTNDTQSCSGNPNPSNNDQGHLLDRTDACGGPLVATYESQGFLAWDPEQKLSPPGDSSAVDFTSKFRSMVLGVGQVGCGYESQMESWYRFLADPAPSQTITIQNGAATPTGLDTALLQQRARFLRPDSLLAILVLTDEDDCSTKEFGQYYYANQQQNPQDSKKKFHLPRARHECATNPNDPCCMSCGQAAGACPPDPTCTQSPTLSDGEDDINLRCFDQKRRFGIDFLYPIDRYTQALSSAMIPDRDGNMVQNPIFSDLDPSDGVTAVRDPGLVVMAGIVGVPWQDIARDPADLSQGFKSAEELALPVAGAASAWDIILGNPANHVPPTDQHMVASILPRPGLPGPASAPNADPINGHEYTIANNDLQYACVFNLAQPRDCSAPGVNGCDCFAASDNPLCDPASPTTQIRAKAYPGQRELSVLKGAGTQGVVASICPSQTLDATRADYAYRPAVAALLGRVKSRLKL
ncbi:MAG: hypothetical protein ABJE95_17945 [Byssovorax sp.]